MEKSLYKLIVLLLLFLFFFSFSVQLSIKNIIPIAYNTDNHYALLTYVSMFSALQNSKAFTFYKFYILVSPDFTNYNKDILLSLKKKYFNCQILFINMGDRYKNIPYQRWSVSSMYRLSLPEILQNENRLLFIDGDTIIFKDLTNMYNIDMKNYYILAFLEENYKSMETFGYKNSLYLNDGIMLMNLREMRKFKNQIKIDEFIKNNINNLVEIDATIINNIYHNKIWTIPPKYAIWNYKNFDKAIESVNKSYHRYRYNSDELKKAYEDPTILHYIYKPWTDKGSEKYNKIYFDYVKKSGIEELFKNEYMKDINK